MGEEKMEIGDGKRMFIRFMMFVTHDITHDHNS